MLWYWWLWFKSIPLWWWITGFGIKYFVVNVWITHQQIAARRANSPYVRPDLLTLVIGYTIALPLIVSRKLIRRLEHYQRPSNVAAS